MKKEIRSVDDLLPRPIAQVYLWPDGSVQLLLPGESPDNSPVIEPPYRKAQAVLQDTVMAWRKWAEQYLDDLLPEPDIEWLEAWIAQNALAGGGP